MIEKIKETLGKFYVNPTKGWLTTLDPNLRHAALNLVDDADGMQKVLDNPVFIPLDAKRTILFNVAVTRSDDKLEWVFVGRVFVKASRKIKRCGIWLNYEALSVKSKLGEYHRDVGKGVEIKFTDHAMYVFKQFTEEEERYFKKVRRER